MLRNFRIARLVGFGVLAVVLLLGLGVVSAQTQQPSDLTVKNLTVIETLTVGGVANFARGLEVVGVLRSKNDANLRNAAQLELDSSQVPNGRRYTLTATLGGLLELRDETAGVARLVIDANGQLKGSLDASSITSGTLSISRLPLGDLDGRYAPRSHTHDTTRADAIYTQDGTRWLFSDSARNTFLGRAAGINNNPASSCCYGWDNTALGKDALGSNTTGSVNTAVGQGALDSNTTGYRNTALGYLANVALGNLTNATAIGYGARVYSSNTIRLGNDEIVRIEGRVGFTATSDKNQKENFRPVDGKAVLEKLLQLPISSWNFIGQDPKQFRHYGPNSQDFFALFGHDGVGTVGDERTINTLDFAGVLAAGLQALYQRHLELEQKVAQQARELEELRARLQELLQRLEAKE